MISFGTTRRLFNINSVSVPNSMHRSRVGVPFDDTQVGGELASAQNNYFVTFFVNFRASAVPTCPEPPGMTIFILVNHPSFYRSIDTFQDLECLGGYFGIDVEYHVANLVVGFQILTGYVDAAAREF